MIKYVIGFGGENLRERNHLIYIRVGVYGRIILKWNF
jgi:hypothetical protein